ncbi:FG-GAP-like repeat-containing protein [Falsiroseomonas sp.]|uniref:FG-GAP-like repeat-containing protein n=1 Tax=Falsiroseomonas sp. TaxID=2870721 RepID=UPI003F6EE7F6
MPIAGLQPSVTFGENAANAAPLLLDIDVALTFATPIANGRLVVGGLLAGDRVTILPQEEGGRGIGFDGTTVTYDGIAIGTASGGLGADLVVQFNADATLAMVDVLIERLAYATTSDAPTTTRDLTLRVVDGAGQGQDGIGALTQLTGSDNPFDGIDVGEYSTPVFVDLDGDGELDLVSSEEYGLLLAWRNIGTATAPRFEALTGSDNPFEAVGILLRVAPAFVDFDGDRDFDLVVGGYGFDGIDILAWRNTGTATAPSFTALEGTANPFNAPISGLYHSPAFLDLEGDGDMDLVVGSFSGRFLAFRNTGTATEPSYVQLLDADNPFGSLNSVNLARPAFVDLDGDGDLDLLVGQGTGTFIAWRNTGSTAAPSFTLLTGEEAPFAGMDLGTRTAPAFMDLDADGDLDVVVGNQQGTLLAFRNTAPLPTITVNVTRENDAPTGGVTLGADAAGLRGATESVDDPDGLGRLTLHWQALQSGIWKDIAGATGSSFTPGLAQSGQLLWAEARFTDAGGTRERLGSTSLAQVGTAGDDPLSTNASGVTMLFGLDGDDTLSGSLGEATLVGGTGNDTYRVDSAGDVVIELADEGEDRVLASLDWTLGAATEHLTLTGTAALRGTGNGLDNRIAGNAGDNALDGGAGNDTLWGGAGKDVLTGGTGADRFAFTAASDSAPTPAGRDVITDWGVGDVIDLTGFDADLTQAGVQAFAFHGVTSSMQTARAGELWVYVFGGETYLIGGIDGDRARDFQIEITGLHRLNAESFAGLGAFLADTGQDNTLWGSERADRLSGGGGDDLLIGGGGKDVLTGGEGRDIFAWRHESECGTTTGSRDVVTDFAAGDRIDLSALDADATQDGRQGFTWLGQLTPSAGAVMGAGQIGFHHYKGNTFVDIGLDGDGIRDMTIELGGTKSLSLTDFIL